jgi:hypothetical protein
MSTKGKLSLIRYIDTEVEEQMTEKSTEWHIEDQCRVFLQWRRFYGSFPVSESKHIRSDGDCWNFQIEWVKIEKYNGVDECHFRVRFHPLMENEYLPWVNFRKTSEELWRVDWNALRENRP